MVTEEETDPDPETLDEEGVEEGRRKAKRPRTSLLKRYKRWVSALPRTQRLVVIAVTIAALIFGAIYLSAVIAYEPWYTNEFQEDIERESQWIKVAASPFEYEDFVEEGQMWTQPFDFPTDGEEGKYVAEFTVFLIWIDDARTSPDTFQYRVIDGAGMQKAAGGSSSGQTMMTVTLNNTANKHVENYQGWTVEVECLTAGEGFIGPGGFIKIPDEGNTFTVRFEWSYFIEHDPDWE